MDDQSLLSLLFFLVLMLLCGLLLVWLMHKPQPAKPDVAMQELEDDVFMEPGTIGKQTNYYSIHFFDQIDALIASCPTEAQLDIEALVASRTTEAQLDADIEEMQRRGW